MRSLLVLLTIQISSWVTTDLRSSYELQVLQSAQRGGMGKTLMGFLYDIARRWNMQKIVLTVFKGEKASMFFGLCLYSSLFDREPSRILALQGYGVGAISH